MTKSGARPRPTTGALFACFVLLLGYGASVTSFTYAISFLFDKHTKAQIITVLLGINPIVTLEKQVA